MIKIINLKYNAENNPNKNATSVERAEFKCAGKSLILYAEETFPETEILWLYLQS
jgi:hypothetical protein